MTGFASWLGDLFGAIEAKAATVTGINQVVNGEKWALTKPPTVVVNPKKITTSGVDQDLGASTRTFVVQWELVVVVSTAEPNDWWGDVVTPLGALADAFIGYGTLGGKALGSELVDVEIGSVPISGAAYSGGVLRFESLATWTP